LSDSDIVSFIGDQRNWILPEETIELVLPEPTYLSGTQSQIGATVSFCLPYAQNIFDAKSGLRICVLNVVKNTRAIDETEGILDQFARELEEQSLQPVDLVKRAWKSSEHDDQPPSA
jgi:hypothetical protein